MNICKCFKCDTCETLIDCRIGMSNRDVQPFQFACPACEENISFVIGLPTGELKGASDIKDFVAPFDGKNHFIDLHLNFPVSFGKYEVGSTPFMKAIDELGHEKYFMLKDRLDKLDLIYKMKGDVIRVINQFKKEDLRLFIKSLEKLPDIELKSDKQQDVFAALYKVTSFIAEPFTIHQHNNELSEGMPSILRGLHEANYEKTVEYVELIVNNGFLKNLLHDCLGLYPRMLEFEHPVRPALYYDYIDTESCKNIPVRISTADFDTCNNFYKDLAEVFYRQLTMVAGLNNLIKRNDYNLFNDSVRLNKRNEGIKNYASLNSFANVDLGSKLSAIDDSSYHIDTEALDSKLRNGIAHYKYVYKESTQLITFYPSKEGMERDKNQDIYLIEFMRKMLLLFREVHTLNHVIKSLIYYSVLVLKKEIQ
ncbi:hypothetical protein [Atlantibacter sp.]|uniref:hypothetical protein n=2 Tax=Atlantibacter sp. TaxID=1903473 RepID=UPI0028A00C68|nr:hypothetical protein [Atlantibacter sp.]